MNIYTQCILAGEKGKRKILKVWPQVQHTEHTNRGCNSVSAQVIYLHLLLRHLCLGSRDKAYLYHSEIRTA